MLWARGLILLWLYVVIHSHTHVYCNLYDMEALGENIMDDVNLSPRVASYKQWLDQSRAGEQAVWWRIVIFLTFSLTANTQIPTSVTKCTHADVRLTLRNGTKAGNLTTSSGDARCSWDKHGFSKYTEPRRGICYSSQGWIDITLASQCYWQRTVNRGAGWWLVWWAAFPTLFF